MTDRKLDEIAVDLDDLATDIDELKERPTGVDRAHLDKVADAIETARNEVDEIADAERDGT